MIATTYVSVSSQAPIPLLWIRIDLDKPLKFRRSKEICELDIKTLISKVRACPHFAFGVPTLPQTLYSKEIYRAQIQIYPLGYKFNHCGGSRTQTSVVKLNKTPGNFSKLWRK